jgi:addiction module RelE/StbE family toxin
MQVSWTTPADDDLSRITRRIWQENPAAARKVAKILHDSGMSLETMPNRGRRGRTPGTREFVVAPFILVYRVTEEAVEILRIYHDAQDWP